MRSRGLLLPFGLWLAIFILIPLGLVVYYGLTVETPVPYTQIERADGSPAYRLEDGTVVEHEPFETQTSFSLSNFRRLADEMYLKLLWRSLYIALITTAICLLIGYPVSMILTSRGFTKHRNLLLMLIILPMWMNFLLRTYAWMSLLEKTGLINQLLAALGRERPIIFLGEGAVILGMVYNFLPFMVLPLYSVMEKIDHSLLDAAADLGANPGKA
ncbi:MAG: ABC transporter permease, partial [Clostridia bacterium]|nr:ABC transporter permease [Clostridia bacterium]